MDNINYKVFGRYDDTMLTADIEDVDECDALNDETFGAGEIRDEWEIEDLSEQTESAEQSIKSQGDVFSEQFTDSTDTLEEMVEKSIFKLMADDDFPIGRAIPKGSRQENELRNIFGSNSPQNPFLQFRQNTNNIWGSFNGVPVPPLHQQQIPAVPVDPTPPQFVGPGPGPAPSSNLDPMQQLLAKLNVSSSLPASAVQQHQNNLASSLKNAKTVEEIEAELLSSQKTPNKLSGDDFRSQNQMTIEQHAANLMESNKQNLLKIISQNNLPPQPMLPPSMMPQLMMNPQIRAAIIACLASGKPLPAGLLPPPPPFMRMPFMPGRMPGHPAGGNFGQEFNSNANRPSPHSPGFQRAQFMNRHHDQRMQPNFHMRNSQNQNHNRDPYAGLMSRREREWLVKIQTLQLLVENPYRDDYYWTMYQNKKMLEAQKETGKSSDNSTSRQNSENDNNLEHRHYVPPTFEGSLGKVQVSSVTCPRQLIDVGAFEPKSPSTPSSSMSAPNFSILSSPSPQLTAKNLSRTKKLTNLLMDIEKGYELILECEELLLQSKLSQPMQISNRRSEKSREIGEKIAANSQKCLNLLSGEKFSTVLSSHKGRRLIGKMFQFLKHDDLTAAVQLLVSSLIGVTRKEILSEVYSSVIRSVRENFNEELFSVDAERDWASLYNVFNTPQFLNILKTQFGYALILTLIYYCAKEKPNLNHETTSFVNRFASFAAGEVCPLASDVEMKWFGRQELATIVFWMTNLVGVDAFIVNRCENQWRSLIK